MTSATPPSTTTRMHHGTSNAQPNNLLPGTRADAVAHRFQCLELVEHTSSARLANTTTNCTTDSAGRDDSDIDAGAEQRRCPDGRLERHCGDVVALRQRGRRRYGLMARYSLD